jgi:hypothetical protein
MSAAEWSLITTRARSCEDGMWYGIVNHRWGTLGLLAFLAVQALVVMAYFGAGLDRPITSVSALDLTGLVAALTVVILAGGHATIRRVTV